MAMSIDLEPEQKRVSGDNLAKYIDSLRFYSTCSLTYQVYFREFALRVRGLGLFEKTQVQIMFFRLGYSVPKKRCFRITSNDMKRYHI